MAILVGAAAVPVVREVVTSTVLANAHSGALKNGASLVGRAGWMRDGLHSLRGRRAHFMDRTEIKSLGFVRSALVEPELVAPMSKEENGLQKLQRLVEEVGQSGDGRARLQRLLSHANKMPHLPSDARVSENRVMGCTSQVWLTVELSSSDGRVYFGVDSDAEVTRGLCAILVEALNGTTAEELLAVPASALKGLSVGVESQSRANTWSNVLLTLQKRARLLMARNAGFLPVEPFPSLLITADDIAAQGDFAEAQARYLSPDKIKVEELATLLREKQIGVVAHFYMDPEVQGVLVAAQKLWPHIHISDSLVMADRAVSMANAGCKHIAVLGVDFMSENVRAILDRADHEEVSVYRMSADHIGCSLAEAAESASYIEFLDEASKTPKSMHVIYINTSLETKAQAHSRVPTITCTSSNVVQTVLQGFTQVPDLTVYYGPDSYMGANLAEMFRQMLSFSDEEIAAIHSSHTRKTIAALLPRLKYFENGTCIVHDMFGKEVVDRVREGYGDAFQTAHFEVPGEMFALAMEAKQRGMGVVGSTSNILDFIKKHVAEALQRGFEDRLQFVLGTESGMVTSIVGGVRNLLIEYRKSHGSCNLEVEIVFPVSSEAVSATSSSSSSSISNNAATLAKLPIVPGVSSGEGCSISGGCASCHYMKMNSLNSLLRVCRLVGTTGEPLLTAHHARAYTDLIDGQTLGDLGCEPILHMRQFQATGSLPDSLVQQICSR
jgi:quinolinate synthase